MESLFSSIKKFGYEQLDTVDVVDPSTTKPDGVQNSIRPKHKLHHLRK